jgi:hypothetical protein
MYCQGDFFDPGSIYFYGYLHFLLMFSTWAKFLCTARRLFIKRKLFLANEFNQAFPVQHIDFSGGIGIICPIAQKKAGS